MWHFVGLEAQTVYVNGTVRDAQGKPLGQVLCKLLSARDSLLTYVVTRPTGAYRLPVKQGGTQLVFSKMGYAPVRLVYEASRRQVDVSLVEQSQSIKGVTIRAEAITRRQDTLNYHVDAFRQKNDVSLEDVIRRLPGIEVTETGQILYQGKSINKFNIEGLDLMGNQYNQATQHMPAEAVATIQVMEHNQPIRALEGRVRNDHATLNVKLKSHYKLHPFGDVSVGVGGSPFCWDGDLTAIQIAKKNQFFATGALNNSGTPLRALTQRMGNYTGLYTYDPLPRSFLSSPTLSRPPFSSQYYLDNHSYFGGINYLHAFTPYSTIRFNAFYNQEREYRRDSVYNAYITAADTVRLAEKHRQRTNEGTFRGQLRYELNDKRVYVEDVVTAEVSTGRTHTEQVANGLHWLEQGKSRPYYVQNRAHVVWTTPRRIYSFSSIVRGYRSDEKLLVQGEEGATSAPTLQTTALTQWLMRHRAETTFDLWGEPLSLGYMFEYKHTDLDGAAAFAGSNRIRYGLHTFDPSYDFTLGEGSLELRVPVEYIHYRYADGKRTNRRLWCAPCLDFSYPLTVQWKLNAEAAYNQNASTTNPGYEGWIANNYRTYTWGTDSLNLQRTKLANVRLAYLNTYSLLSWNLYVGFQQDRSDLVQAQLFLDDYTLVLPEWKDRSYTSWSVSSATSKQWRKAGIYLRGQVQYAYNKDFVSQNAIEDYLRYHALNASLTLRWTSCAWLQAHLVASGNLSWKEPDAFSVARQRLKNGYYALTLDCYPVKPLRLYLHFSQSAFEIASSRYAVNSFLGAGFRYDITRRWSLSADARNLLNRRDYQESLYTHSNYRYFRVPLRGREMMVSLRYHF